MLTNFEYYKEEIISVCGEKFIDEFGMTQDGKINKCRYIDCTGCRFETDNPDSNCEREALRWLLSKYEGGEDENKL